MRKFRFDKLVRDKIPDDQRQHGANPDVRTLSDTEYLLALRDKLLEESREIEPGDRDEILKEVADIQEVLDCIVDFLGSDRQEVESLQAAKRDKAGSFIARQYIETVEVPHDNPWIEYYEANPDRYPEVKD